MPTNTDWFRGFSVDLPTELVIELIAIGSEVREQFDHQTATYSEIITKLKIWHLFSENPTWSEFETVKKEMTDQIWDSFHVNQH